jgi:hypothetical protein
MCVKLCPVDNIRMEENEYPENLMHCQHCLRCTSFCPKQAIPCKMNYKCKTYRAVNAKILMNYFQKKKGFWALKAAENQGFSGPSKTKFWLLKILYPLEGIFPYQLLLTTNFPGLFLVAKYLLAYPCAL